MRGERVARWGAGNASCPSATGELGENTRTPRGTVWGLGCEVTQVPGTLLHVISTATCRNQTKQICPENGQESPPNPEKKGRRFSQLNFLHHNRIRWPGGGGQPGPCLLGHEHSRLILDEKFPKRKTLSSLRPRRAPWKLRGGTPPSLPRVLSLFWGQGHSSLI